jgi:hypothetical protein
LKKARNDAGFFYARQGLQQCRLFYAHPFDKNQQTRFSEWDG